MKTPNNTCGHQRSDSVPAKWRAAARLGSAAAVWLLGVGVPVFAQPPDAKVAKPAAVPPGYEILYSFRSVPGSVEGRNPDTPLLEGSDGALYGITPLGGAQNLGTLFRFDRDSRRLLTLRTCTGSPGDGREPVGGLIEGKDGVLVGTANGGGTYGVGIIFKLKKDGEGFTILHHFSGEMTNGRRPRGRLLRSGDGFLYGAAGVGGIRGAGIIYRLREDGGGFEVLHHFSGMLGDGSYPESGLTDGENDCLYGTTLAGGGYSRGTIFRLKRDGSEYAVLRAFSGGSMGDGADPWAGLILGPAGRLYGTTGSGGRHGGGTLFAMAKEGSPYSVLHEFGVPTDGRVVRCVPAVAPDGALLGTTVGGGKSNKGVIFRAGPDGRAKVLREFGDSATDGASPVAGVIRARDGAYYGTTAGGGQYGVGTLFRFKPEELK